MVPSVGQSIGISDGLMPSPTLHPEQTQTAEAGAFQKLAQWSVRDTQPSSTAPMGVT